MRKLIKLLKGKYLLMCIITPLLIVGEVIMEVSIPRLMADIVNVGITNKDIAYVTASGIKMVVMAAASLCFGAGAGWTASIAAMGFGTEIRKNLFYRIQDFSFSNVDKFTPSSLITRMTTDITNTQNALMLVIRSLVRSPIMLVSASVMAFSLNKELSMIFLIAVPILAVVLAVIISKAHPRFKLMLKQFDKLNEKIQENLIGIRVVKAFVRGEYEDEGFEKAAAGVRETQKRAVILRAFFVK